MAPVNTKKRKRPHDKVAAPAPPPAAYRPVPVPAHQSPQPATAKSTVQRRATRQSSESPLELPWQADPEPRRRRRRRQSPAAAAADDEARRDKLSVRHLRPRHHNKEAEDAQLIEKPKKGKQTEPKLRSNPTFEPPSNSPLATPAPAPESAPAPARAGMRGRPPAHQQRRPAPVRSTDRAESEMTPKPLVRHRILRPHRYSSDDVDIHLPDELSTSDASDLVVPLIRVSVDSPTKTRRRGSIGDPSIVRGSTSTPTKAKPQTHKPILQNTKTVPVMPQPPPRAARTSDQVAANTSKPFAPTATHTSPQQQRTQSPGRPPQKKKRDSGKAPEKIKSSVVDRNIDKVVFGNVCFSTWYHSPYGTEALKEISGNSIKSSNAIIGAHDGHDKHDALPGQSSRKTKEGKLDRLYVCPSCFKYSKELVPWWQHVHSCERRGYMPGQKIYTHPKAPKASQHQEAGHASSRTPIRNKKSAGTAQPAHGPDDEGQGEWSIWQVDGEDEGLFCQNLSLFAKLFLDNKSVFFDVAGFHYFLLVHTTPRPQNEHDESDPLPPKHQVVGFFSKEKLSWDNNNLACILIFPPWQRKGLGALLMGISYEISRREGCLGGPEKPISDLGKKGYKRFWGGEIAAWLLSLDTSGKEEVVIDVEECSQATWIVPEDCLMMLREMGVIEQAGMGPPKKKKRLSAPSGGDGEEGAGNGEEEAADSEEEHEEVKDVARVRISKDAVWDWVQMNRISLEKTCDPDGFVEGYAIKKPGIEEDDG